MNTPSNQPVKKPDEAKVKAWVDSVEKRISSGAMILETRDGRLLINKANYKRHWSLPGGIVDPGETPLEAAVRETKEEMGLVVDPQAVKFVAIIDRVSTSLGHTYQFVFRTTLNDTMIEKIVLQAEEIDDFALVTRDEVATKNRLYGKVIHHWANGRGGYIEQTFAYDY